MIHLNVTVNIDVTSFSINLCKIHIYMYVFCVNYNKTDLCYSFISIFQIRTRKGRFLKIIEFIFIADVYPYNILLKNYVNLVLK